MNRIWRALLDLALVLWIVRVPVGTTALAYVLLAEIPETQDLLIPLAQGHPFWIPVFFVSYSLLLAMPIHYSARLLLDDDERFHVLLRRRASAYLRALERWAPRVLGAVPFIALMVSANRAIGNLPTFLSHLGLTDQITAQLHHLMIWTGVVLIIFIAYAVWRSSLAATATVQWIESKASAARPVINRLDIAPQRSRITASGRANHSDLGRLLLILLFGFFVIVLLVRPSLIAELFPRTFAIALVLGGWLPIFTYLSSIGRRLQAPFIFGWFLVAAVLTIILGDNHDVRRLSIKAMENGYSRIPLQNAVDLWMSENHCSGQDCPRPIVIAAAGGASRASFFTATVIGELLEEAKHHGLNETAVRKRLFAISSVSGGSVATIMTVAALAAGGKETQLPCPPTPFSLWHGGQIESWRGCLEALVTGDFLTPVFIGLTFHDMLPFSLWLDRATMLERALERRFADVMARGKVDPLAKPCPASLKCPFMNLRPRVEFWLPLSVLNGVSVNTGQRIITTALEPTYRESTTYPQDCATAGSAGPHRLFAEAFHFHDLLRDRATLHGPRITLQRALTGDYLFGRIPSDIRLSTAALNSGRFPILLPPGGVRNEEHYMVDRIVDGGYFENYGITSALELVYAIHAVNCHLKPFVLVISNDPEVPINAQEMSDNTRDTDFVTDLSSAFYSVSRARKARGTFGIAQLRSALHDFDDACGGSFAHIRVWPQDRTGGSSCDKASRDPRAVSMSLWLSTPVQMHLAEETDDKCNSEAMKNVWKALESTCEAK